MKCAPHIARLSLDLSGRDEVQLLPDGEFAARDGRPGKGRRWHLDAAAAQRLVEQASTRETPYVIDYDHQTLMVAQNGQPAPAAGWFKALVYRPGQGLYATDVQWTERARALIDAGEYRFLSPVFGFDDRGTVTELLMAAITNVPALDQLEEVQLKAAASLSVQSFQETSAMNELLKKLLAALALPETTSEADAVAACTALKAKADGVDALQGEVVALRAKVMDPTKFVPVEVANDLKTQVAALTTRVNEREVEDLILLAIAAGKLATPAEQAYARSIGKDSIAQLRTYIEAAPAIPALRSTQTGGSRPAGQDAGELSDEQLAICRHTGLAPDAFKAALKDSRATA